MQTSNLSTINSIPTSNLYTSQPFSTRNLPFKNF